MDVGIVGSWAKHVVVRIAELVASRVRAQRVEGQVGVVTDTVLLTRDPVAEAKLQVIDPVSILEEGLLIDTPSESQCREDTPAVLLAEARGAVGTDGSREEIAVEEAIVQTAVEGYEGILRIVVLEGRGRDKRLVEGIVRRIVYVGLPVLIGIPCHDIQTTLDSGELLDIVSVEVKEQATLTLVVGVIRPALQFVGLTSLLVGEALPA